MSFSDRAVHESAATCFSGVILNKSKAVLDKTGPFLVHFLLISTSEAFLTLINCLSNLKFSHPFSVLYRFGFSIFSSSMKMS